MGRATQGVTLIALDEGAKLSGLQRIVENDANVPELADDERGDGTGERAVMTRPYNFSAGPAAMPEEVLQQAAAEMLDWHGSGMSVMEMSHRGKEFMSICETAEADLRELLAVPANFRILFMQGGGLAENAIVPMNLSRGGAVDFVVTGSWSQKSIKEARKLLPPPTWSPATRPTATPPCPRPASWQLSARRAVRAHLQQRNHPRRGVSRAARPEGAGQRRTAGDRLLVARGVAPGGLVARRPGLRRRAEEPGPGRPDPRGGARRPARPRAAHLPQRVRLQDRGRQRFDVQHAARPTASTWPASRSSGSSARPKAS